MLNKHKNGSMTTTDNKHNKQINTGFTLFNKKTFWMGVLIPPFFITLVISILCYITKDYRIFEKMNVFQIYFTLCGAIFIVALLVSLVIYCIKSFIKSDFKGRILIVVLLLIFAIKAFYEIIQSK